jgi:hypothetical protein
MSAPREESRDKSCAEVHRNVPTSDDAKYASARRAAAIKTKVNKLLLISLSPHEPRGRRMQEGPDQLDELVNVEGLVDYSVGAELLGDGEISGLAD